MLRSILHLSVRVVPTRTDARYIPTGKPVELRVQNLAAKRLPRKRYCTAGDLPTIKNIGGRYVSLSRKPLQKRSISNLHIILLFFSIIGLIFSTCSTGHVRMMSQLPTPERRLVISGVAQSNMSRNSSCSTQLEVEFGIVKNANSTGNSIRDSRGIPVCPDTTC